MVCSYLGSSIADSSPLCLPRGPSEPESVMDHQDVRVNVEFKKQARDPKYTLPQWVTEMKREKTMTMTKIALLVWKADIGHLGVLVIAICGIRPQKDDGQDN